MKSSPDLGNLLHNLAMWMEYSDLEIWLCLLALKPHLQSFRIPDIFNLEQHEQKWIIMFFFKLRVSRFILQYSNSTSASIQNMRLSKIWQNHQQTVKAYS